ncbi:MAG: pumilio-like protein [Amphiamblys sp. WSBS2006]|nr:MAG: pumilio-like protein [Amphiamblys sp. WSBS2006]OIR57636.1 MAG: pumilio-like protein [Amphiamblys sp. WSBS2006]
MLGEGQEEVMEEQARSILWGLSIVHRGVSAAPEETDCEKIRKWCVIREQEGGRDAGEKKQLLFDSFTDEGDLFSEEERVPCVEMIQKDFPETPSSIIETQNSRRLDSGEEEQMSLEEGKDCYKGESALDEAFYAEDVSFKRKDRNAGESSCVLDMCRDQCGSRMIQQRIENGDEIEIGEIFGEIRSHLGVLTRNIFGNYVVQKLFEFGNREQTESIFDVVETHLAELSIDVYGCRVVQCVVQSFSGGPAVQKTEMRQRFFSRLSGSVCFLCKNAYGCRLVQRLFEHDFPELENVFSEVAREMDAVIIDKYGNYVVQHVLLHGAEEQRAAIYDYVQRFFCVLSEHKFASNVVEKTFLRCGQEKRMQLIEIVVDRNSGTFKRLVEGKFGNYVIQRALGCLLDAVGSDRVLGGKASVCVSGLKVLVDKNLSVLKKFPYGKNIIQKTEAIVKRAEECGLSK